jgi:hypothetical protein
MESSYLNSLNDEEMDEHYTLRGYDGRWSLTTKLSIIALDGVGLPLHLNYLWALTPQQYRCPVCTRAKPALMRKVRQRILAQLCIDHDHIMDYLAEYSAGLALKADYDAVMSFRPLIICNQCNTIDSALKLHLPAVHRDFTFTPAQKQRLFKPYKRSSHWVHIARGEEIWQQEQGEFFAKLDTIAQRYPSRENTAAALSPAGWTYHRYVDEELKLGFILKGEPGTEVKDYYNFLQRSVVMEKP